MALVVLLRGVNVGGHRTFRPTTLADQLKHLDTINIGAAGTFVIRRPVTPAQLRAQLARRLPFDTEIMICQGREIVRLTGSRRSTAGGGVEARQALPANSRVSVCTLTRSPSWMNSGTRISSPVSSVAAFVTPPEAVSPRTPGSV